MTITDQHRIDQGPSTDVAHIAAELTTFPELYCPTPLAQYAQQIFDFGVQYNVDPAFFLATTNSENIYGTFPGSAAWDCATQTGSSNWTSISGGAYGGYPCPSINPRFGCYPTVLAGIEAFFKLITIEYYPLGQNTLGAVWWGVGGNCLPCVPDPKGSGNTVCGNCIIGNHAYGPCNENYCGTFYNPNQPNGVLATMNRLAVSGPPGPGPTTCTPPYVYDPLTGACVLPGQEGLPVGVPSIAAILAGGFLLGGAIYLVTRSI